MTTTTIPKTIGVHKLDCEGVLIIDGHTGQVTQPPNERPEWSDGLTTAMLAERIGYYHTRTGKTPPPTDLLAFEDLGWIAVNPETGDAETLEANAEFRNQVIVELLKADGITATDEAVEGGDISVEIDMEMARETRTTAEVDGIAASQAEAFGKTATGG